MPWAVTLKVTSCSTSATLAGATINDGYQLFYTDANGQFIAIIDDFYTGYIIDISKSGYVTKRFHIDRSHSGTIQTICLTPSSSGGGGGGGGGGGW